MCVCYISLRRLGKFLLLVMPLCINCGPSVSFSQFGRTSWVAGLWFKDCAGRGLAGNLTLVNGIVLRVIGVYGPSGASLPGFDSMAERVSDERPLVSWVCSQISLCSDKGWYPLMAG